MTRVVLVVSAVLALAGCGGEAQGERAHPHEEPHGQAMAVAVLEQDLLGQAFVDQSEETVRVTSADCVAGTPNKRRDVHHVCVLRFGSGLVADEVAVHVVEDGWIFYSDVVIPEP